MTYCLWKNTSAVNQKYHDEEWGVPLWDDIKQFEFLMMEVMQCGLSWNTVINKREIFRQCFDGFDFDKIANYGEQDIARILATPGMIQSRRKVEAVICNARCVQRIRAQYGRFADYLWGFSEGKTIEYDKHQEGEIPSSNRLADIISRDLKQRGFKFVGGVTIYAHLQAAGIINDHGSDCPRYRYIHNHFPWVKKRRDGEINVQHFG